MNEKKNTIFCDIDGTIFKYRKFGTYEETLPEVIQSTLDYLNHLGLGNFLLVLTSY